MIHLIHFKKYIYFSFKRRMPTCYLLSSKSLLTLAICLSVYFVTMDIILFDKARNRGPFQPFSPNLYDSSKNLKSPAQTAQMFDANINNNSGKIVKVKHTIGSVFKPLPVKKIMMAEATHFIRSPIAELVEYIFGFSELFPFITANVISVTHCILSVISIKYLIHDSLFWRQFGVLIFLFRNFLDSFDGVIYRAHAKKTTYKSHYGSMGYFVDAFSDVFGGLCLIGSIAIYFLKRPPPPKTLTRCFRLADEQSNEYQTSSPSFSNNSQQNFHESCTTINEKSSSSSLTQHCSNKANFYHQINYTFNNQSHKYPSVLKENNFNGSIHATKPVVLVSVALVGIRLALCALFWDRSVHAYEDLLDCRPKSELHQDLQVQILKSVITIFIMFSWRIFCALSLQDMLLVAIFIDKTWEFIVKTQHIGWILLICLVILTELHVAEIRSILTQAVS